MPIAISDTAINLKCLSLDSRGRKEDKTENLRKFCEDPEYNVCLLLMGSAAAGLNLTIASVCYFLEPTANAADEAQALGRVHRIGQTKPVRCVIFYTNDSFEERLLAIREKQGNLKSFIEDNNNNNNNDYDDGNIDDGNGKAISERIQAAQGKSIFFNQQNLTTLFGVTETRKKKKEKLKEEREANMINLID